MLSHIQERLQKVLVLDGGVSSEISQAHPEIDKDPLWSCRLLTSDHGTIKKVHHSFLEAGADIIGTVTYQSSIPGFERHFNVTADEAKELIKTAVRLAIETRDEFWENQQNTCVQKTKPLVAAALGPYGAYLADGSEYSGDYMDKVTSEELRQFHRERIEAVLEAGPDLLALETIPAGDEALVIAKLLRQEFPTAAAWICFSCKNGECVYHGETLRECTDSLLHYEQVVGVGINCTPPQCVEELLKKVSEEVKSMKTIVVYANSGEYWTPDKSWEKREDCPSLAELIPAWRREGAQWIGGCCQITPSDITQIRTALTKLNCFTEEITDVP